MIVWLVEDAQNNLSFLSWIKNPLKTHIRFKQPVCVSQSNTHSTIKPAMSTEL